MATAVLRRPAGDSPAMSHDTPPHTNTRPSSTSTSSSSRWLPPQEGPLVMPSDAAFKALLLVPLIIWWLAMAAGVGMYEGLPKGQKVWHLMTWFDRGFLRPAGPLIPFLVLFGRIAIHAAHHLLQPHGAHPTHSHSSSKGKRAAMALGSLALSCGLLYVVLAVARVLVYATHYWLLKNRYLEWHLVSDHIFLAGAILASLQIELVCLLADITAALTAAAAAVRHSARSREAAAGGNEGVALSARELGLTGVFISGCFLYLFVVADMFYTARYYHFPMESAFTVLLVGVVFQAPALVWVARRRRLAAAAAAQN